MHELTILALGVCIARRVPVILWGDPGSGKTTTINSIAEHYNLWIETVIASIREPADFSGLPAIARDENGEASAELFPPSWAKRVARKHDVEKQASIVFYDEISTAPPAIQAALLRPILEGVVGDLRLPGSTITVAAANPPKQAAGGWELSAPTANRFTHLKWAPDANYIKEGFIKGFPPATVPMFKQKELLIAEKKARALVGIFLGTKPELLSVVPDKMTSKKDFNAYDYAFPTSRSWEVAAKLFAACEVGFLKNERGESASLPIGVRDMLLRGTIGAEITVSFLSFVKNLDLQDPNKLLDSEIDLVVPDRGDKVLALLNSLEYAYRTTPQDERWRRMGDIICTLIDEGYSDSAYIYAEKWVAELRPSGVLPSSRQTATIGRILDVLGK